MDIRCPVCGEPWDMDSLHEETEARWPGRPWRTGQGHHQDDYEKNYYGRVRTEFRVKGCAALGARCSTRQADPRLSVLYNMLGDDLDGAASMMEDEGW